MNRNIILTGMSGAGKSTLGVLLAKALGMDFIDTDIVIQQRVGRTLQSIINSDGIERFMETEESVVSSLALNNCVTATGGSVIYSDKAMTALKRGGIVVCLYVDFDELEARLTNITTRGIVMRTGSKLEDVYKERLPLYQKYADMTIDCTGRDIESCVGELVTQLRHDTNE